MKIIEIQVMSMTHNQAPMQAPMQVGEWRVSRTPQSTGLGGQLG